MNTREGTRIDINLEEKTVNVGKHEIDFTTLFYLVYEILEKSTNLVPGCTCIEFVKCMEGAEVIAKENGTYAIELPFERHSPA